MSLDIYINDQSPDYLNVTHNMGRMASAANIYKEVWRPEECTPPITTASQMIPVLIRGIRTLRADPAHFKEFNPENGWGNYEVFLDFLARYLSSCVIAEPNAAIRAER